MASGDIGPGVRRFMDARTRGERVDVAALAREYPNEALELAEAVRRAAAQDDSRARQLMWFARAEVLNDAGEDATLGAILLAARRDRNLTTTALSNAVRRRGANLLPLAIDRLEANQVMVANVDPAIWTAVVAELQIDRHLVVAGIQMALDAPRAGRSFTRMDRGASASDREKFLDETDRVPAGHVVPTTTLSASEPHSTCRQCWTTRFSRRCCSRAMKITSRDTSYLPR